MRIAMISFHTCPLASQEGKETGGMNVYVFELAKKLAILGHQIDMYTRAQAPDNREIVEIGPGLRLIHLKAGALETLPKKSLIRHIPEFVESYLAFTGKYKQEYDVLHCHYYLSGMIGLELNRKAKPLPLVMTFHTLALMKNLVARDEFEKEEVLRIEAERQLTQKADAIIAPSDNEKEYLQYLYDTPSGKIHIVPPGVDTRLFRPMSKNEAKAKIGADPQEQILLFVGRIEPLKGLDMLMYALKVLKTKHPDERISLWIVGGDVLQKPDLWSRQLKHLHNLTNYLHIPMLVKFVGQKPQSELPSYYNAAEMVIMPSHYESFGMVALEAMACGTATITTNVAGISSVIDSRHRSFITTVNNPLLLAKQIAYLLDNESVRNQMSHDLFNKAQEFSWDRIVEQIISIYQHVL